MGLEKKTGQPKSVLVAGAAAAVALLVLLLMPAGLMFDIVGTGYPVYGTLVALATSDNSKLEANKWMTYWVLFAALRFAMPFLDIVLAFVPFSYYLKLAGLVFLYSPVTNGATMVLDKVLQPFVFPLLAKTDAK